MNNPIKDTVRADFNISFPLLSCEFTFVDVSDVLGTACACGCTFVCPWCHWSNLLVCLFLLNSYCWKVVLFLRMRCSYAVI
ncbi:hypothetical protein Hdeb2414_s0003g00115291 [Helianthus debilis subsp. tardiflorus]